jgi:hypothetical protein
MGSRVRLAGRLALPELADFTAAFRASERETRMLSSPSSPPRSVFAEPTLVTLI